MKKLEKLNKYKHRPVKWFRKTLSKKKNQRKAIYATSFFMIIALMFLTLTVIESNKSLEKRIQTNNLIIKNNLGQIKKLDKELKSQSNIIEDNTNTINEKTKTEAELKSKIDELNKQVETLQSYGNGIGGGLSNTISSGDTAGNSYGYGYCTWGVKSWKPNIPNFWGNANEWDSSARASGFAVDSNPRVGDVAQTDAGGYGHVAMVVAVSASGVTIQELNGPAGWNVIGVRTVPISEFVYIHI